MKNMGNCAILDHAVFRSMDVAQRPVGWDLDVTAVVVKHRAATGYVHVSCVLLYATRLPCSRVE
jgi:hypothetical protein